MSAVGGDRDILAAEHALGLTEGDERREAAALLASDPGFAAAVAAWQARLSPMFDAVSEAQPSPALWERIEATLEGTGNAAANDNQLERRARWWRGYGVAMTGLAAALALAIGLDMTRQAPPVMVSPTPAAPATQATLVAALTGEEEPAVITVAYDPSSSTLIVTPARVSPDPEHNHELWIIPAGGQPVSLGVLRSGSAHRVDLRSGLGQYFRNGATLAVSVEPVGGSPTGAPTGPVVASGSLNTV